MIWPPSSTSSREKLSSVASRAARSGVFEQRVASADGAHVTLEQRQVGRLGLGEQQIEEPPAGARGALDQLQILGAKHHGSQHAEIIAQAFDRLAVQRQFAFARRPVNFDFPFAVAGQNCRLPAYGRADLPVGLDARQRVPTGFLSARRIGLSGRGICDLRNLGLLAPALSALGGGEGDGRNCPAYNRAADKISLLSVPDHLRAADTAERAQRGHEIHRFEDVRLALRVVAEQQVEARRKVGVQPRVIAEVPESQMGQMHTGKMNRKRNRREFFRQGQTLRRDSRRKLPVEILVMANPNPDPQVAVQSLGNGAIIPRYTYRPKARVRTQPFQLQRRVGRILQKLFVSGARSLFGSDGKCAISLPETWCSQRRHGC